MTIILPEKQICAICGKTSTQVVLHSTSCGKSSDLDTRPDEPARSSIDIWIHTCPKCGYCAPNISQSIEKASELITDSAYQKQLHDPRFPKLANAFLCCSMIEEYAGCYADAGWESLHAAWVCDDVRSVAKAKKCRRRAAGLWQKAREFRQKFGEEVGDEEVIMADVLRRSGQFELALRYCDAGLNNGEVEKWNLNILSYQKALIAQCNVKCHTVSEIPKTEDERDPKWVFDGLELVARIEHRSKAATKRLLMEEGTLRYIRQKLKSEPSFGIEQIAHLEHKPKSKSEILLIKKGLESYLELFKEAVRNKPPARRQVSAKEITRIIGELQTLIQESNK